MRVEQQGHGPLVRALAWASPVYDHHVVAVAKHGRPLMPRAFVAIRARRARLTEQLCDHVTTNPL